jgi:hypothetical protein
VTVGTAISLLKFDVGGACRLTLVGVGSAAMLESENRNVAVGTVAELAIVTYFPGAIFPASVAYICCDAGAYSKDTRHPSILITLVDEL